MRKPALTPVHSVNQEATLLKRARVVRDRRLETLDMKLAKRLLENQPTVGSEQADDAEAVPVQFAGEERAGPRRKMVQPPIELPIASEFVRMAAPAHGMFHDRWTGAHFSARLLSERALCECTLELGLKPDSDANTAQVTVKINGQERHSAQLKIGQLNRISFRIDVAAGAVFDLELVCDYVKTPKPPDLRRLSYILRSLQFA
jgi:hypothetical protein